MTNFAELPNGNVVVLGSFRGNISLGSTVFTAVGTMDTFVVVYNPAGAVVAQKKFGAMGAEMFPAKVEVDGSGNIVISGGLNGAPVSFGGPPTQANTTFVVGLTPTLSHRWTREFAVGGYPSSIGVTTSGAGRIAIHGRCYGGSNLGGVAFPGSDSFDACLALYDESGSHLWSYAFGSYSGTEAINDVTFDSAGNVYVTGFFSEAMNIGTTPLAAPSGGLSDVFVAKFNPTGAIQWAQAFGGTSSQFPTSITLNPAATEVVIPGTFFGSVTFNGQTGSSVGDANDSEGYIARYSTGGSPIALKTFPNSANGTYFSPQLVEYDSVGNIVISGTGKNDPPIEGQVMTSSGTAHCVLIYRSGWQLSWKGCFGGGASIRPGASLLMADDALMLGGATGAPAVDFGGGSLVGGGDQDAYIVRYAR